MFIDYCLATDLGTVIQLLGADAPPYDVLANKWNNDPESIIIAIDNDEIIGTITLIHDPLYSFIYNLIVREDKRRQGVGTALVQEALYVLQQQGTYEVGAYIVHDNEPSKSLCRKLGWHEYGNSLVAMGYKLGKEGDGFYPEKIDKETLDMIKKF